MQDVLMAQAVPDDEAQEPVKPKEELRPISRLNL